MTTIRVRGRLEGRIATLLGTFMAVAMLTGASTAEAADAPAMDERLVQLEQQIDSVSRLVVAIDASLTARIEQRHASLTARIEQLEAAFTSLLERVDAAHVVGTGTGVSFLIVVDSESPGTTFMTDLSAAWTAVANVPGGSLQLADGIVTVRLPTSEQGLAVMASDAFKSTMQRAADRRELTMRIDVPTDRFDVALRSPAVGQRILRDNVSIQARGVLGLTSLEVTSVDDVGFEIDELLRLVAPQ